MNKLLTTDFTEYMENYYNEKGEYPLKFKVRVKSSDYATIDHQFENVIEAVNFMQTEFSIGAVYECRLYTWRGELLHGMGEE